MGEALLPPFVIRYFAIRNPGFRCASSGLLTSFFSTRFRQTKEAERRQTCFETSASLGCGARPCLSFPPRVRGRVGRGRARLSAFHHGSDRRGSRPFDATPGQVSWDAAGRPALYGRPNRGARASRSSTGVIRARLSQSREAPPGPVVVPVNMMPEAARERTVSVRPRAPHSLHLQEYPRPKASFTERDSMAACNTNNDILSMKT